MITEQKTCIVEWLEKQIEPAAACQSNNCFHTQGSGVARKIREAYPVVMIADCKFGRRGDPKKLGYCYSVEVKPNKYCYGIFGQYTFGLEKRQTNYEAIYSGLERVKNDLIIKNIKLLGIPKRMGCALGGGDWRIVSTMIDVLFGDDPNVECVICDYVPPTV